ncbi:MAG: Mur ligase family protein [Planctomycetota bacterium]|nr:Mur ligase family protein [Planctomycetota bacterium]
MDRLDPKYINAIRFLYERINYEKTIDRPYDQCSYRLGRMKHLLEELGNPHLAAPVVHVAGTKGKGSTSWLIAETLRRSGLRVGLYTSPHLMHLEERFLVDSLPSTPSELAQHIESLKLAEAATAQTPHGAPTFFEMTTALAWTLFAARKTDVNVIEVGLGGRLDSTNVCQSALAIITSISYDHQQQLGNTISLIASEKAGIIKQRVPVISGARHPEAQSVIRSRCHEMNSELWEIGTDFESEIRTQTLWNSPSTTDLNGVASRMDFIPKTSKLQAANFPDIALRMAGKHQADNAAIAIAAWARLNADGWSLPRSAVQTAIAETQLCCRIELVSKQPDIIIDTSHNVASIGALIDALKHHFAPAKKTIVFACSKDKEYEKMLDQILAVADRLIITQFHNNPRSVPVERLEELAKEKAISTRPIEILSAPSSNIAVEHALKTAIPNELICITGSFFLAAETRPMFPSQTPEPNDEKPNEQPSHRH